MSENNQDVENQEVENQGTEAGEKEFNPFEAAEHVARGKLELKVPIIDGEREYTELKYDFNALTALEMARAMDKGAGRVPDAFGTSKEQALSLFATAAAKATGGLDATDILQRLSVLDGVAAIRVAAIFFNSTSMAGSLRFSKWQ